MAKPLTIETLLRNGSTEWNKLRKLGRAPTEQTGATFAQLFSANADLSSLALVGSEWDSCDLTKVSFRETDLSNAYFHGGRLQDCDFRGANLEGATFERMKLLRCDFTGAKGVEELELDQVDMDRVVGLGDEPPPPPPPAVGLTSFTRDRSVPAPVEEAAELPPFRPQDPPHAFFSRAVQKLGTLPQWVLDVPGLRPPAPPAQPPGSSLEGAYRDAVRARLEGRKPNADGETVKRAQRSLRLGSKDAVFAACYLREVGVDPAFRFSSARVLKDGLRAQLQTEDLTGDIDPRSALALYILQLPHEAVDHLPEARRRLAATQLFFSLLEAGFTPEHNWQEALDATDAARELEDAAQAGGRPALEEAFRAYAALPEDARLRRLAYLAETVYHLDQLGRLPSGVEPRWLHEPESRECHDREMRFVQALSAAEIPNKVPELAQAELGIPVGSVPEESEDDLFIHLKCSECGKEKLLLQSP